MYDSRILLYLILHLLTILLDSEALSALSLQATNEHAMEEMLRKVEQTWAHAEFDVIQHTRDAVANANKEFKEVTYIVAGVEEVNSLLEESQIAIAALRGSRFIGER
jgi:dynein heavy chain, axonemal